VCVSQMQYSESDACPRCWHLPLASDYVPDYLFQGGVLDKHGHCTRCECDPNQPNECKDCRMEQPCPQCYAGVYNGTLHRHMPLEMHKLYMRNSPYQRKWSDRPRSLGEWYGGLPQNYQDVIRIFRRFTQKFEVQQHLNALEHYLSNRVDMHECFWRGPRGFSSLCQQHFSSNDDISATVLAFHDMVRLRCSVF
jgi:hypothetical protein